MPSKYTCNICGEAIPRDDYGTILSYRHWLDCSYKARKAAHEATHQPIDSLAFLAGHGLRCYTEPIRPAVERS